jgi:hypothetical protein
MKNRLFFLFAIILVLVGSCGDPENKLNIDVSEIPQPNIKIKRYEQAMFPIPKDSFFSAVPKLQKEYSVFLQGDIADTAALIELRSFFTDPYMVDLYKKSMDKYPSLDQIEEQLNNAMQHFEYYSPLASNLQYYSYISGLDVNTPVKFIGNSLIIGIDNYLGANESIYLRSGFPKYKIKWLIQERIVPDAMDELAAGLMPEQKRGGSLLENMIYKGKVLYFTQAMIPNISDSLLLEYSKKQYTWCRTYEGKIWGLLIDNQFLFKKDQTMVGKFMNDGPFTTVFSNTSPSRIGWFVGWRIVSSYMNKNDISLEELLQENNAKKILKLSKYKPKD